MSSERFESLEDDFVASKNEINRRLDNLQKVSGEVKKAQLREVERKMDEAQSLLKELESELGNAPHPYRQRMNQRLRQYKDDMRLATKKLSHAVSGSSRDLLLGRKNVPETVDPVSGERSRVLQIHETLNRTTDGIARTQQIAAETDMVGTTIVEELDTQRESLLHTKDRLAVTDENISKSRKILRSMYRRVMTNKLILIVIILLELGILSGIVYYKFFMK